MTQTPCPCQATYFDASLSIILDIFLNISRDYYLFNFNHLPVLSSFIWSGISFFVSLQLSFAYLKKVTISPLKLLFLQLSNAHTLSSYIVSFETVLWSVLWFYHLVHTFFDVQCQNMDKIFTEALTKLSRIWYFQHIFYCLYSYLEGKVRCMSSIGNSIPFCIYVWTGINHIQLLLWRLMICLVLLPLFT